MVAPKGTPCLSHGLPRDLPNGVSRYTGEPVYICTDCRAKQTRATRARAARTKAHVKNSRGYPWTHEEVRLLRELSARGLRLEDIALRIGRSYQAIAGKRYELGIGPRR